MSQPLDPTEAVKSFPTILRNALVSSVKRGYDKTEEMIANNPICIQGPHLARITGFNRYAVIEHSIYNDVASGLLQGTAKWIPFSQSESGHYLLYEYGNLSITFSHVNHASDLPKKSEYRLNRAYDNQLRLDDPFYQDSNPDVANLVFIHGNKSLEFAHLLMLGSDESGKQKSLYLSENLVLGDSGFGNDFATATSPTPPVSPASIEHISEPEIKLHDEFNEDQSESSGNE